MFFVLDKKISIIQMDDTPLEIQTPEPAQSTPEPDEPTSLPSVEPEPEPSTEPETEPVPVVEPEPEPELEPEPEPEPEPVPEPVPEPPQQELEATEPEPMPFSNAVSWGNVEFVQDASPIESVRVVPNIQVVTDRDVDIPDVPEVVVVDSVIPASDYSRAALPVSANMFSYQSFNR
jgi:outer membrane biosynthesis protein TonB